MAMVWLIDSKGSLEKGDHDQTADITATVWSYTYFLLHQFFSNQSDDNLKT